MKMSSSCIAAAWLLLSAWAACGQFGPFGITGEGAAGSGGVSEVIIRISIPAGSHLYGERLQTLAEDGRTLQPLSIPPPVMKPDPASGSDRPVYEKDLELRYRVDAGTSGPVRLTVVYQGCQADQCFLTGRKRLEIGLGSSNGIATGVVASNAPVAAANVSQALQIWRATVAGFDVVTDGVGYMPPDQFLAFLAGGTRGQNAPAPEDELKHIYQQRGLIWMLLAALLGGFLLNLTPCILPMIPINIAIIGAGAGGQSKRKGFLLGATYGLGIATTYGVLGLLAVRAGARFGQLNASPWFNTGIAVIFLTMALAMFGAFQIDLSRWQGRVHTPGEKHRGRFSVAFFFGAVAALLAGACVAPVVIGALLLATDLYAQGRTVVSQALPFVLGLGMALPWPLAGAGLTFLPKPGAWMERIKQLFGVLILLVTGWYAWTAYEGFAARPATDAGVREFTAMLEKARRENRAVFVDFGANWCKNCLEMERTTFQDPKVKQALSAHVVVKFKADDLDDPEVRAVLDHFKVPGLPKYLLLRAKERSGK